MPESRLWLVNHLGGAFTLGTSHRKFKQLENTWDDAVTVKRLSASHWCAWAIGHDHRVYVYVLSSDVPIRVPETVFENQRWTPIHGFSKKSLLPSDRSAWSNEEGTADRPKESVRLPSAHWEWEGDWFIDDNLRGEVVGMWGWQYAFDFPAVYSPEKHWNSFVRKRKWVRFRRYSSTDVWARISDAEVVERTECFIDVNVGGFLLPSQPTGFLSVWAVTNNGHVYVRTNVNHDNPEGSSWQEVDVADHMGVINISVGASNLIWGVTWDGNAVVRTEVSRNCVYGTGWALVKHPDDSTRFMQVSVGKNAVWAICRDGKVWFRQGTSGDDMFWNEELAMGTAWVEMVGEMSHIAVSSNDQVFAVDFSGKTVYFRTGVTRSDLTGKTWQPISLHEDLSALEREGLLSEGAVCSCGDPDVVCTLHDEGRPRLSSTTTTSSSISTATNVDDASGDVFASPIQPYQPFPSHFTEPLTTPDSAWERPSFALSDQEVDDDGDHSHEEQGKSLPSAPLANAGSASYPTMTSVANSIEGRAGAQEVAEPSNIPQSVSSYTLTSSTSQMTSPASQTSTLSHGSSPKDSQALSGLVTGNTLSESDNLSEGKENIMNETQGIDKGESPKMAQECSYKSMTDTENVSEFGDNRISHEGLQSTEKTDEHLQAAALKFADEKDELAKDIAREISIVPHTDVPLEKINFLGKDGSKDFTELTEVDRHLQECENCPKIESIDSAVVNPAVTAQADTINSSSALVQFVKTLHSSSCFPIADAKTGVNKSTVEETTVEHQRASDSFPSLVDPTSVNASVVSCEDSKPLSEPAPDLKEGLERKSSHQKKKVIKERQPKIVNLPDDDPEDDSIVFRPNKLKKKKRERKIRSGSDETDKPDSKSISSDHTAEACQEHAEAQQFRDTDEVAGPPTNSQQLETCWNPSTQVLESQAENIDLVDSAQSNELHSAEPYEPNAECPRPYQPAFQSLEYFSSDLLAAGGYNTDAAISMFTDSETFPVQHYSVPVTDWKRLNTDNCDTTIPASSVDASASGIKKTSPSDIISNEHSERSCKEAAGVKGYESKIDMNSELRLPNSSNHNSSDGSIPDQNLSNQRDAVYGAIPNKTLHNQLGDEEKVIPNHAARNGLSSMDGDIPHQTSSSDIDGGNESARACLASYNHSSDDIYGTSDQTSFEQIADESTSPNQTFSDQKGDVSSTGPNETKGDTGLHSSFSHEMPRSLDKRESGVCDEEDKQNVSAVMYDLAQEVEDMEDAHSTDTLTDDKVPDSQTESNTSSILTNAIGDRVSNRISKSTGFASNKFNRLDSISDSDEILDFVTDLMSDEEVANKDKDREAGAQYQRLNSVAEVDTDEGSGEVSSIHGSGSFFKSGRLSCTSMGSTKSGMCEMSSVSKEFTESGSDHPHIIKTGSQSNISSASFSGTSSNSPPKNLPLQGLQPARKLSKYRKSPSLSQTPSADSLPLVQMIMAQPRLCWRWLDATSCVIDDPASVEWLSTTKDSEPRKKTVKISRQLRDDLMRKIQERNKREIQNFKNFEQAINRTTWVKKASMQIYLYNRHNRWVPCNVELEQGIADVRDGCLTMQYQQKRQQKHIQLSLSEITCVKMCADPENTSGFTVYTATTTVIHQPLMLKASSESEACDWIGYLCAANATAWNMNMTISPGAIWACTFSGDVFVSPDTGTSQKSCDLCWGQHGGHMGLVETGPSGVTWALGFDKMPYVYNGGYGGAVNCGVSEMSDNTQQITDYHRVFVYENQKWFPVIGWCNKGIIHDNFHWQTESGRCVPSKDAVKLPSSKWQWTSRWTVDFSTPGGVDKEGWQYSNDLWGSFHPRQHLRNSYRRRRWVRRCRITMLGPWQTAGSLGLADISIQTDPVASTSDPVVMWAVGANGDVLSRYGVTTSNPLGKSWIHVPTDLDKPFKSISVGGDYRVWGIAGDGSAWFRPGVSPHNLTGKCWLQVVPPPPGNFLLHQVSVGATSVWAVDTGDNLWRRENITPTFPEGTGWELVASRVKRVSVGPSDQVWIVTDANFCKWKHGAGVIYNRLGITSSKPSGTDWEVVIGNGWAHVSVRGMKEIKLDMSLSTEEKEKGKNK